MKELHPEHHAVVLLGFGIGARPSTLRPIRRSGPESDVLWDEGVVLLRRSNPAGEEIRDFQKTKVDQDIPLPPALMRVLRAHVAALPAGPMRDSPFLFPLTTGGMRSRSELDKPFRDVLKALGWTIELTPKGCGGRSTTSPGKPRPRHHLARDLRPPDGAHAAPLLDGAAGGDARGRRQGNLDRDGAAASPGCARKRQGPHPSRRPSTSTLATINAWLGWPMPTTFGCVGRDGSLRGRRRWRPRRRGASSLPC